MNFLDIVVALGGFALAGALMRGAVGKTAQRPTATLRRTRVRDLIRRAVPITGGVALFALAGWIPIATQMEDATQTSRIGTISPIYGDTYVVWEKDSLDNPVARMRDDSGQTLTVSADASHVTQSSDADPTYRVTESCKRGVVASALGFSGHEGPALLRSLCTITKMEISAPTGSVADAIAVSAER